MLGFIFNLRKIHREAHEIKSDETRRNTIKKYGIWSIIFSILQIGFSYGAYYSMKVDGNTGLEIFIIVVGFILTFLSIYSFLGSLFFMNIQLYMNKKPISFISLAVFIAVILNSGFILFYFK